MFRAMVLALLSAIASTAAADDLLFEFVGDFAVPVAESYEFKFAASPSGYLSSSLTGNEPSWANWTVTPSLSPDMLYATEVMLSLNGQTVTQPIIYCPGMPVSEASSYRVFVNHFHANAVMSEWQIYVQGVSGAVPEPGALALLSMGAVLFGWRRRFGREG